MPFLDYSGLSRFKDKIMIEIGKVLPSVTSSDNGKILQVKNGVWTKDDLPEAYSGILTDIHFSIATSDWVLSNGVYTYDISDSRIIAASKEFVLVDDSAKNYLIGGLTAEKDSTTHHLVFSVDTLPTGTISGTVWTVANNDGSIAITYVNGKLPISSGGTNATTAAEARTNLGAASNTNFVGATVSGSGTAGLVPAPTTADMDKALKGDGTWGEVSALPAVTSSDNGKVLQVKNGEWEKDVPPNTSGIIFPVEFGTISSLPQTVSDNRITSDMLPVRYFISDQEVVDNLSLSISSGSATLTGTLTAGETVDVTVWIANNSNITQFDTVLERVDSVMNSTLVSVAFSIAVSDWTLSNDVYTATFLTENVTTTSIETIEYDSSVRNAQDDIDAQKKSGGGGIVFTTAIVPTGTLSGRILVIDTADGKTRIIAVNGVANNLTTTLEGFALDARQGKVLADGKADKTDAVLTTSQTFTDAQKSQARSNISAASKSEVKPFTIELDAISNANGSYSHTTTDSRITEDMKAISYEVGTPETFRAPFTVTTADGSVTLTCANAVGSSTVSVTFIKTQPIDSVDSDPSGVTSSEFDILAGRIGTLSSLTTSTKTSMVAAANELDSNTIKTKKFVTSSTACFELTLPNNGKYQITTSTNNPNACVSCKTIVYNSGAVYVTNCLTGTDGSLYTNTGKLKYVSSHTGVYNVYVSSLDGNISLDNVSIASATSETTGYTKVSSVNDQIANVDAKFTWTRLTGIAEATEYQIPSGYTEIYVEGTFSSGYRLAWTVPVLQSRTTRYDSGFYYTATDNAGGNIVISTARKLTVYHPRFNGTQTTFSEIYLYAR